MSALGLVTAGAAADVRTQSSFVYQGGAPDDLTNGRVLATWNAQNPKTALAPGLKVFFFGQAVGCPAGTGDGPTVGDKNAHLARAAALTGVRPEPREWAWTPSGDHPACGDSTRTKTGDSFVVIGRGQAESGIGLFTYTGRDESGAESFFQQLPAGGRNGKGSNAHIEGTFVIFRFDWQGEERIRPWGSGVPNRDPTLQLRTLQSVVRADVKPSMQGPVQAKQQVMFTTINRDCFRQRGTSGRLCQIQYLFNTAVFRAGVTDWGAESWFKTARVWFDPQQGALPIVSGPIPAAGQIAMDAATKASLYSSGAAQSQHGEFSDKAFIVRVTFSQLANAMRAVAAARLKRPVSAIGDDELAGEFGARWSDPNEWILLSIQFGQEVHNPSPERRAFIGGNMREVSLGPADQR